jgi:hypothetical protein
VKRTSISILAVSFAACVPAPTPKPPPADAFYFPTGIVQHDGFLYVASSNFDKRFDTGAVSAVNLGAIGLPPLGELTDSSAKVLENLGIQSDGIVAISSFGGEMDMLSTGAAQARLFIPSRSEGSLLQIIETNRDSLRCFKDDPVARSCIGAAPSLIARERTKEGVPRAPEPIGVGVGHNEVWLTHLLSADAPFNSQKNFRTYAVHLDALSPDLDFVEAQDIDNAVVRGLTEESFDLIGTGATNSVVVGNTFAYVTGRFLSPFGHTVRLVARNGGEVVQADLESQFRVIEARGIAFADATEKRLYVAGRSPDTLLVVDVDDPNAFAPSLRVVRNIPLPEGANEVKVIPRVGSGPLVVVTCSTSGTVAIYDDEAGTMVAQLAIGDRTSQPYGIALQPIGLGYRIFISLFGDGRVAAIDIPDLVRPQDALLVAMLGKRQTCLLSKKDASCQ